MAQIVKLINSVDGWTLTRDTDFSLLNKSISNPWVVEWLVPTQGGGAGTDITVWTGEALVKVTRTSVTPNEVFYVVFRNTVEEILTVWNNKKIFIEIETVNINTPSNNTSPTGENIWSIKIDDNYPSDNFLKLWETDWSGLLSNHVFEFQTLKQDVVTKSFSAESTNGTDSYTITIPWITAYTDWLEVKVKADVSNTGSCTLDINGLGAKEIKKQQGTVDLVDGDWGANGIATLVYNSDLDVFQFEGESSNSLDLDLDINWLTEKTNLVDNDEFIIYDSVWLVNKKSTLSSLKNSLSNTPESITTTRNIYSASWTITYNHNIWKIPSMILVNSLSSGWPSSSPSSSWSWVNDWSNTNKCIYEKFADADRTAGTDSSNCIRITEDNWAWQLWNISNVTTTTFDVNYTLNASPSSSRTLGVIFNLIP